MNLRTIFFLLTIFGIPNSYCNSREESDLVEIKNELKKLSWFLIRNNEILEKTEANFHKLDTKVEELETAFTQLTAAVVKGVMEYALLTSRLEYKMDTIQANSRAELDATVSSIKRLTTSLNQFHRQLVQLVWTSAGKSQQRTLRIICNLSDTFASSNISQLCPTGWNKSVIPGKCLKFVQTIEKANRAPDICGEEGGVLASIESKAENDFIIKTMPNGMDGNLLLGGIKNSSSSWSWTDGANFIYTNWGTNAVTMVTNSYYDIMYLVTHHSALREVYFGKWGIGKRDVGEVYYPLCSRRMDLE